MRDSQGDRACGCAGSGSFEDGEDDGEHDDEADLDTLATLPLPALDTVK